MTHFLGYLLLLLFFFFLPVFFLAGKVREVNEVRVLCRRMAQFCA